eukprot:scaffold194450_cov33-Prasinocladus_malaysianus.AAC.1
MALTPAIANAMRKSGSVAELPVACMPPVATIDNKYPLATLSTPPPIPDNAGWTSYFCYPPAATCGVAELIGSNVAGASRSA